MFVLNILLYVFVAGLMMREIWYGLLKAEGVGWFIKMKRVLLFLLRIQNQVLQVFFPRLSRFLFSYFAQLKVLWTKLVVVDFTHANFKPNVSRFLLNLGWFGYSNPFPHMASIINFIDLWIKQNPINKLLTFEHSFCEHKTWFFFVKRGTSVNDTITQKMK